MSRLRKYVHPKNLVIAFIIGIQLLFILTMANDRTSSIYLQITFVLLLIWTYRKTKGLHQSEFTLDDLSILIWIPIGALSSFYLNQKLGLGAVLAGSIVGFTASFLPSLFKSNYWKQVPAACYCGAFIGMTSPTVSSEYGFIITASLFAIFFYWISKSILIGIGGKLGTVAFIGVILASLIFNLLKV